MNTLIKLTNNHYVVVDDSEIKVGDYYLRYNQSIMKCTSIKLQFNEALNKEETIISSDVCGDPYERSRNNLKKITHSTLYIGGFSELLIAGVKEISLKEVKELIGEVDVEKKAEKFIGCKYDDIEDSIDQIGYDSFIRAYNQALEDNKEKKYTEEDVIRIVEKSRETGLTAEYLMMTSQPKTKWEVEFIDGKLTLKKQAQ